MNVHEKNNITNIISSFSNIDKKILSLQKSSTEDFKNLYKLTKETYIYTKKINQNTTKLFNQFDYFNNEINKDFKQKIYNINSDFENYVVLYKMNIIKNIDTLETILNNYHLLFSPLNNIKNNLLDLFFLLTQQKLKFLDNTKESSLTDEKKILDNEISNTKSKYDVIISDINLLKANMSGLIQKTRCLSEDLSSFEEFLSFIKLDINNIKNLQSKAEKQHSLFKEKSEQSLEGLDIIITNLQYQDIIHQKMQHVQQTYNQIVDELKIVKKYPYKLKFKKSQFKHLPQLSNIVKIQTNQLIATNKNYQNTINIINNNLSLINKNLSSIKKINLNFYYEYLDYKKNTLNTFNEKVKKTSSLLINLCHPDDEINKQISTINEAIKKVFLHFNSIKSVYTKVKNEISKIEEPSKNSNEQEENDSLTKQILTKYESIDNDILKSEAILKKNRDIMSNLDFAESDNSPDEIFLFLTRLNKLFNRFYEINGDFFKIKDDNSVLINELITNLENITKNFKDYNPFELTIKDINNELTTITNTLSLFNQDGDEKTKYFFNYSTKEERDVHDEVLNNKNNSDIENKEEKTENDVEFF